MSNDTTPGKRQRVKKKLRRMANDRHDANNVALRLQEMTTCSGRWMRFNLFDFPLGGAVLYCRNCGFRVQVNVHDA